ncbi:MULTISPECIES: restriction endonuclease subunit S [Clostridium]|uniref:restriction endonuclease subunit S n=1 Tax=Clostridium TaxID=1485 RepID=UPI00321B1270
MNSNNIEQKFRTEWHKCRLDEICDVIDSLHKSPKYVEVGYPMIRVKDMKEGYLTFEDTAYVTKDVFNEFNKKHKPKKGDILFSRVGSYGITTYVNTNKEFCLGQNTVVISNFSKSINNKYLYYYLISNQVKEQIEKYVTGSTQKTISMKSIKSFEIMLPTIEEQARIAKVLSDIDDKIETNNEINKKLEEMAQAIFKQWFVDFEFPNEDGKPYKSSGGEMVESELGIIPEGWKIKELKEVIKFNKGKKPKIITDKEFDNSKLYLTIDVLNRNSIQYAINDKVVLANKKDILMVMDGASSGSLYYGLDGIVGSTLSKLVINDEYINDDILYYFLKLNEFNIKGHLTGSAIPHTDKEYVNRLIMCIPNDKELLVRVTKILSDIREKVIINNEENSRLIKLRDILLPKLMSGEIRVPLGHE